MYTYTLTSVYTVNAYSTYTCEHRFLLLDTQKEENDTYVNTQSTHRQHTINTLSTQAPKGAPTQDRWAPLFKAIGPI